VDGAVAGNHDETDGRNQHQAGRGKGDAPAHRKVRPAEDHQQEGSRERHHEGQNGHVAGHGHQRCPSVVST